MLDTTFSEKLNQLYDTFSDEQDCLERIARSIPLDDEEQARLGRDIARSSHASAQRIVDFAGEEPTVWQLAKELLHKHPLHKDFLLQSEFIAQALRKPYGYAGDKDLMLMIYRNANRGHSIYAELKNHVYQSLPAAEAVREGVRGMERMLRSLPDGSRVLCLACGPAWEIQQIARDNNLNFTIDLLDHDRQTLNYTRDKLVHQNINHILCNAFDIVKGQTSFEKLKDAKHAHHIQDDFCLKPGQYDLIYSIGLYDYISSYPKNPARGASGLTERLFHFLKPGGHLIAGNFLAPGGSNLHRVSHQFMMEVYSEWKLLYRTPEAIRSFTDTLDPQSYRAELLDETVEKALSSTSVIGFLDILKL